MEETPAENGKAVKHVLVDTSVPDYLSNGCPLYDRTDSGQFGHLMKMGESQNSQGQEAALNHQMHRGL